MPNKLIMSIFLHTANIINKHDIADIKNQTKFYWWKSVYAGYEHVVLKHS